MIHKEDVPKNKHILFFVLYRRRGITTFFNRCNDTYFLKKE